MSNLKDEYIDILVSHYPPYGILDEVRVLSKEIHIGIVELNNLISRVKLFTVFTHVVVNGVKSLNNTLSIGFVGGMGKSLTISIHNRDFSIGFNV